MALIFRLGSLRLTPPSNPVISFLGGVTTPLHLSGGLKCVLGAFLCDTRLCVGGAEGQRTGSDTGVFVYECPGSTFPSLKTKPLLPMTS